MPKKDVQYREEATPVVPKKQTLAPLERKKSDAPTVAIAPSGGQTLRIGDIIFIKITPVMILTQTDYEHIFHANAEALTPNVPKKAIQYREEQAAPVVPKKPTLAAVERKKSDAPTVAIAPSGKY